MTQKILNIIEIFNSIQSEGSHIGEPSTFIRTAGSNLPETDICISSDFPYPCGKGTEMEIHEIFYEIEKYSTKNIVLTGGEPTLQEHGAVLCRILQHNDYKVFLQTNGAQWTSLIETADHILMDMKPKISDLSFIDKLDPDRDEVKVLAGDVRDLEFAHKVNQCASEYNLLTIIQVKNDLKNDTHKDLITKYKWLLRQEFLEPVRVLPDLYNLIKF